MSGYTTTVAVSSDGRVTIPADIRDALGVEDGDLVEIDVDAAGGSADERER